MAKITDEHELLELGLAALDEAEAQGRKINPPVDAAHAESLAGMLRLADRVDPPALLATLQRAEHDGLIVREPDSVRAYGSSPDPVVVKAVRYRRATSV